MYKLILILLATAGSPHDVKLTWEVTGFVSYEDCLNVGEVIANDYRLMGFTSAELTCEAYDVD